MISPTLKKLRYRPGARVVVRGAPTGFETELAAASEIERVEKIDEDTDIVQVFLTRRAHLERQLGQLHAAAAAGAIVWIGYPKAKALGTDLNRDVVRRAGAAAGLEAVAIVAVDEIWSALRCKKSSPSP